MKKQTGQDPEELRRSAEQRLAAKPVTSTMPGDEKRLVHELQVHQIELEMINENLSHAQAELEKSWACYYDLYELAPVGYLTVNDRGNILNANLTATNLLGVPRKALLNMPLTQFILAADQDQYNLCQKQLLQSGRPEAFELQLIKQDGCALWVRVEMNRLIESDEPHVFRVVLIDISERKQAEIALQEADRQKDEFLAMLAHELRNPLTPISNLAQTLGAMPLTGTTSAKISEMLNRNVNHITHLVDDLLDVSRITRGLVAINRHPIELGKLLKDTVETVQSSFNAKQQTLELHEPDQPVYVDGDPVRLTQVFSNLLINANKYTGKNGHIDLKVNIEGPSVIVRVQDNGIGIEPQLLPHIFDLFTQGKRSLARSEGGLGIGLTLVKKLVELHGGEITAVSQGANQGSEFVIKLPSLVQPSAGTESAHPLELNNETKQSLRILLIDDNEDVLESISLWLEMEGHQVKTANNGTNGISIAQSFTPDIILLDIGLPDMDGYEVAKKLREQPNSKKSMIVAMSGYSPAQAKPGKDEEGFDHYLLKPPKLDQLQSLIIRYQSR